MESYIFPSTSTLNDEELNFELKLRNKQIYPNEKLEQKQLFVKRLFTEDREKKTKYKGINFYENEKPIIVKNVDEIIEKLNTTFDRRLLSRLRHYLIRANYALTASEFDETDKTYLIKEIEDVFTKFKKKIKYSSEDEELLESEGNEKDGKNDKKKDEPTNKDDKLGVSSKLNASLDIILSKLSLASERITDFIEASQLKKLNRTGYDWSDYSNSEDERERGRRNRDSRGNKSHGDSKQPRLGEYDRWRRGRKIFQGPEPDPIPGPSRQNFSNHGRGLGGTSFHNDQSRGRKVNRGGNPSHNDRQQGYDSSDDYGSGSSSRDVRRQPSKNRAVSRHRNNRGRSLSSSDGHADRDGPQRRHRRRSGNPHRRDTSDRSSSASRHRRGYRRSRVENWDLIFSGDNRSIQVEDFLYRIKKLAKHEDVSQGELLRNIHHRLKGEAYDWWFTREENFTRWSRFEDEIRFRYGNPNRDRGIRAQIRELKQKRGEKFVAYVTEVEKLNQCLVRPFSPDTLFELIWENMRPHYRSRLSTITVEDLEHLIELNHKIDANDPFFFKPLNGTRNDVNHLTVEESDYSDDEGFQVNAIQKQRTPRQSAPPGGQSRAANISNDRPTSDQQQQPGTAEVPVCWNCQAIGHAWRECTKPKLVFCYACGKLGRTARTCEKNHYPTSQEDQDQDQSTNWRRDA